MRQSCEDVYCARDDMRQIEFTVAIKSVLPSMQNLNRQSCEDVYRARDVKLWDQVHGSNWICSPFYAVSWDSPVKVSIVLEMSNCDIKFMVFNMFSLLISRDSPVKMAIVLEMPCCGIKFTVADCSSRQEARKQSYNFLRPRSRVDSVEEPQLRGKWHDQRTYFSLLPAPTCQRPILTLLCRFTQL
jgi:hypothetical protein